MRPNRRQQAVRVFIALVGCSVLLGGLSLVELTVAPGRPTLTVMSTLPLCVSGQVVLTDMQCDDDGKCATKAMRVEWSRMAATLFAVEGEVAREVAQLSPTRLRMLLDELAVLDPLDTDGGERECWGNRPGLDSCPRAGHRVGLRSSCSGVTRDLMLMRASFPERMASARLDCYLLSGLDRSVCLARSVVRTTFATRYSRRIEKMLERLAALGRELGN